MVKQEKIDGMSCHFCEECNMAFVDRKKACECEEFCKKHKACNIEIIKYAIKQQGGTK